MWRAKTCRLFEVLLFFKVTWDVIKMCKIINDAKEVDGIKCSPSHNTKACNHSLKLSVMSCRLRKGVLNEIHCYKIE